ncbi:hypothetical protein D4A92_22730 (plasmid) [Rhizobium rosettiformans]|uniref:Oligosaccharide repeat unit polymerase n=1 Tax=Rhizobium rosettiformans TaxID=1368430 RepID=A0ABX7F2K2_9HYPH|nr:hypothetical protein [Rhizobium rosettiformans]QRF54338.1 hypothetical protein D4A92_22730 [Rhizobium rosettiformans]
MTFSVLAFWLGALLSEGGGVASKFGNVVKVECAEVNEVSKVQIAISALPGLIGVFWIVASVGIPLFDQKMRFYAPFKATFLAEFLSVPIMLIYSNISQRARFKIWEITSIFLLLVLIAVPGYRNFPVMVALLLLVSSVMTGQLKLTLVRMLAFGALAGGFFGLVNIYRRSSIEELLSAEAAASAFNTQLPSVLAQLHYNLREPIGIGQILTRHIPEGSAPGFIWTDLLSILPWYSDTAGKIISGLIGSSLTGGLNMSFPHVLYFEYGANFSYFTMASIGLLIGLIWRNATEGGNIKHIIIYGYSVVAFVLLFQRGVPKASIFLVPTFFIIMFRYRIKL